MLELKEIIDFVVEEKKTGLRNLTAEQQDFLEKHNIELIIVRNTANEVYFILPSEQEIITQINDENLSQIIAAKTDCAGTAGSIFGTAACFSTYPVCLSTVGTVGSGVGTAGTASSGREADDTATQVRAGLYDRLSGENPDGSV